MISYGATRPHLLQLLNDLFGLTPLLLTILNYSLQFLEVFICLGLTEYFSLMLHLLISSLKDHRFVNSCKPLVRFDLGMELNELQRNGIL